MKREEIDVLWGNAVVKAIARGDQATRYCFAEMVAAAEREACAVICDKKMGPHNSVSDAIRARGKE